MNAAALTDFFTFSGNPGGQPSRSPVLAPKGKKKRGTFRLSPVLRNTLPALIFVAVTWVVFCWEWVKNGQKTG
jgi:hypothetical protein